MKNDIIVSLGAHRVNSVQVAIDIVKQPKERVAFNASVTANLHLPGDEQDKSFLLKCSAKIWSEEYPDFLTISLQIDFYFEVESAEKELDDIITEQCMPIIQNTCTDVAANVLDGMGYPGLIKA